MSPREDFSFANDIRAANQQRAPRSVWLLLIVVVVMLTSVVIWASVSTLEEVTSGSGRVIPSSQIQVIQTLEGGIVREIIVREGDIVEEGQILIQIDDTGFASLLGELAQQHWSLLAKIARLEAEANGHDEIVVDDTLSAEAAIFLKSENEIFLSRRTRLKQEVSIFLLQRTQKEQELKEMEAREQKIQTIMVPLNKELDLTSRMRERGVIPEIELLRLQRQVAELAGELAVVTASLPRARTALEEADVRIQSAKMVLQIEAREQLAAAYVEFAVIEESIKAARDRVARTSLRSPVRGTVNKLNVASIGSVVRPGQQIVEIVPMEDILLIEANIRPRDIAFIHPGQNAKVKLTAYDYSIYGSLDGIVERISADTIRDGRDNSFYRVIVRTDRNYLENKQEQLPIIPGMIAQISILTGEKTILDYLLKPITKIRHEALRER